MIEITLENKDLSSEVYPLINGWLCIAGREDYPHSELIHINYQGQIRIVKKRNYVYFLERDSLTWWIILIICFT